MRSCLFFILYMIATDIAIAQQSDCFIPSFPTSLRSIPATGNAFIKPILGDSLASITMPHDLQLDEILLRRRFGKETYGLYKGKKNNEAFKTLSAFPIRSGHSLESIIYKKLYMQKVDNLNMDMINVYFDNNMLYVENAAKVFVYDSIWHTIPMVRKSNGILTIHSFPDSAIVFVDGIKKGNTPIKITEMSQDVAVIEVRKDGYYKSEIILSLSMDSDITRKIILSKMVDAPNGTYIDPDSYTAENRESVDAVCEEIALLKTKISEQKENNEKALIECNDSYPPFTIQKEFEKTETYLKRKELYYEKKKATKMSVVLNGKPKLHLLEEKLLLLEKTYSVIENRLYYKHISASTINLKRYIPDKEYFPITINVKEKGHNFTLSGVLPISVSMASDIKENLNNALLKLTYRNKIFVENNLETKTKILYEYTKFSLLYKGGEFEFEGTCTFPDSNTQLRQLVDGFERE